MSTEGPEIPEDVMQAKINALAAYLMDAFDSNPKRRETIGLLLDDVEEAVAVAERTKSTAAHAAGYREGLNAALNTVEAALRALAGEPPFVGEIEPIWPIDGFEMFGALKGVRNHLIPPSTPEPSRSADEALQTVADLSQEFDAAVERDAVRGLVKALRIAAGYVEGRVILGETDDPDDGYTPTADYQAVIAALTDAKEARLPGTEDGV